jgi:hypothetical protein
MKSIISKSVLLLLISTVLFSFLPKPGGEGFEIYLNNKVVIQKFGNEINTVQSLQLEQSLSNAQIVIKYHHCGRVGKNRIVTIKDGQNKVLKEFRYADTATPVAAMSLNVKDILSLKKGGTAVLKLYYVSSELAQERLLTTIISGTQGNTKP